MEVSITQFRQRIFELVSKAMEGNEIWVNYKGQRFQVVSDKKTKSRLSRITPLAIVNSKAPKASDHSILKEMTQAWEKDWSTL